MEGMIRWRGGGKRKGARAGEDLWRKIQWKGTGGKRISSKGFRERLKRVGSLGVRFSETADRGDMGRMGVVV